MEDSYLSVGCVHLLTLSRESGITPKGGFDTRNKLFVVIGVAKMEIYTEEWYSTLG